VCVQLDLVWLGSDTTLFSFTLLPALARLVSSRARALLDPPPHPLSSLPLSDDVWPICAKRSCAPCSSFNFTSSPFFCIVHLPGLLVSFHLFRSSLSSSRALFFLSRASFSDCVLLLVCSGSSSLTWGTWKPVCVMDCLPRGRSGLMPQKELVSFFARLSDRLSCCWSFRRVSLVFAVFSRRGILVLFGMVVSSSFVIVVSFERSRLCGLLGLYLCVCVCLESLYCSAW